jgi:CubicO group peptidase (beta-lactamase class C family)
MRRICFAILLAFAFPGANAQSSYFSQSTAEAEGISSEAILKFIESAEKEIDAIHSFMILRHGKLISQGWWDPFGPDIPHVMHSLSKSFTSTAIGIAVGEGLLSLDGQVISFFPEHVPEDPGWQLEAMRIRDLITMNTGHINEPRALGKEDWVKVFLDSEVDLKPGTHFRYNSMATYMLSAIMQEVTGEKLVDYLDTRLFQPLQIKKPEWDECPKGINVGGWGLHIVTEDIAKLGQLYLQKGKWQGRQILSEEWVDLATSKQTSNGSNPDSDWEQGYGFQFWRCRHNCYRGDGAMGQFCIVMPEKDAVIAITSGANDMAGVMQLVWNILLPAMEDNPLPADNSAFAKLEQRTSGLKLKPVDGEVSSPVSKKISKQSYTISENSAGVNAISFNLSRGEHMIKFEMDEGTETISIGSGQYSKGELQNQIPFANKKYKRIATTGAWVEPEVYQVKVYQYETPALVTYTFKFSDGEVVWDSKPEHSLFGPRKQVVLKGKQNNRFSSGH